MNRKKMWWGVGVSLLAVVSLSGAVGSATAVVSSVSTMVDAWTGGTGVIYYTGGDVGVGTSSPSWQLQSAWSGTNEGAVYGQSTNTNSGSSAQGVQGRTAGGAGSGVAGYATSTGTGDTRGVYGQADGPNGVGTFGYNSSGAGAGAGVQGQSSSTAGTGVFGSAVASTGTTYGVRGEAASSSGRGVLGVATYTGSANAVWGIYGSSSGTNASSAGVAGQGVPIGVFGDSPTNANGVIGVLGQASSTGNITSYGVYGLSASSSSTNNWGVWAQGKMGASGTKSMQIDHPLDPANRFLTHYCAEGPEPYLVYRGTALLDDHGEAVVELPEYFEAINRDWTYQLTPIGASAMLYIASEVANNSFVVAGGLPGTKLSWTVTGVRNDRYVQEHPPADTSEKSESEKGSYVMPELYGLGPEHAAFQIASRICASRSLDSVRHDCRPRLVSAPDRRGPLHCRLCS